MAYNRKRHVKQVAQELSQMIGTAIADFDAEDIDYVAGECQCNYEGICEILGLALPESLKPVMAEA